ncbi:MAG: hypothetical protein US96_C0008G0011 [Candidatus Woesebacteria bacterium GW2011_GWB1_38_5b]|uniref:Cell division protein FtsL n=1 Tax=Candidatus Woesebacteria bacterium GW2011_GWB1_38_5b TaxID=1618569 RepID=A0A0G0KJE6_9BACT|nr:MAG: hypothetical protein US96_C0008G0011 [Candidatus Woesebacteria bacterium GW2011_GWB1_38_5b]
MLPLGLLFSLNVFLSIGSSSQGAQIIDVERKIKILEDENRQLTQTLVIKTSLTKVSERVEELNLVRPTQVVYLNKSDTFAKLP